MEEIKEQIIDEAIISIVPVIKESCSYCDGNEPQQDVEKQDCHDGWYYFEHTKKCYKHFQYSEPISWMFAQHECWRFGGDLAMIFDPQTNELVYTLSGGNRTWLGAFRVGPIPLRNDQWTWIDGKPMEFSYWSEDQPDNYNGYEFCLEMWPDYGPAKWNDLPCDIGLDSFICQ